MPHTLAAPVVHKPRRYGKEHRRRPDEQLPDPTVKHEPELQTFTTARFANLTKH